MLDISVPLSRLEKYWGSEIVAEYVSRLDDSHEWYIVGRAHSLLVQEIRNRVKGILLADGSCRIERASWSPHIPCCPPA